MAQQITCHKNAFSDENPGETWLLYIFKKKIYKPNWYYLQMPKGESVTMMMLWYGNVFLITGPLWSELFRQDLWWGYHVDLVLNELIYPQTAYLILSYQTAGKAWVPTQHCDYWCPGAKAPGHQYPQCWLNRRRIGLISWRNVLFIVKNSKKRNDHLKKKWVSCWRVKTLYTNAWSL